MSSLNEKHRYNNIDCLRTIGCLSIIAMHVRANTNYQITGIIYNNIIPSWTWMVNLFFIISGFCMCCGYYEKILYGHMDLGVFYKNRMKRVLPFFSCLVMLAIIAEHSIYGIYEGLFEVFMVYGLLPNNTMSVLGVCWTLEVIFLYYMLFPYFCFWLSNKRRAWFAFFSSLVINQLCSCYFFTDKFVIDSFVPRHSFLFCVPYFMVGGLLFLYRETIQRIVNNNGIKITSLCVAVTIIWHMFDGSINGHIFYKEKDFFVIGNIILFSLWMILAIGKESKIMSSRVFHFLGKISFEMYLAQMLVFRLLEKMGLLYICGNEWLSFFIVYLLEIFGLIIFINIYKRIEVKVFDMLHLFEKYIGEHR